jgi:outer membrane protein assembly factor BamA
MNHLVHALAFLSVLASTAPGQEAPKKPIVYVGEVIIVGNTITQDRVIRQHLMSIQPGQILDRSELKAAEKKLIQLGLFKYDPGKKIGPTVMVLDTPGPFKDILVKVEEQTTRKWDFDFSVDGMGRPIVRLVLEDRNFDLFAFPTSIADIEEEKAFRGGGQNVRFELVRLNIMELRHRFFADGQLLPIALRSIRE